MKKLLLFVLFAAIAAAQQRTPVASLQPDCMVTFNFTAISSGAQAAGTTTAGSTGTTPVIDNRTDAGCVDWLVTYSTTTGISALSLLFQTATNVNGVPGTWSTYGGTLSSGINPNTAATPPWAITSATGNKYPFLRMNLTALTGTGTVSGNLYGWKRHVVTATIAPGTICTAAAPCPVDGPTAAGSPPVFPPVLVAGQDGTNLQTIRTDTAGNPRVVGPDASGAASATNPVQVAGTETGGTVRTIRTDNVGIVATQRTTTGGDAVVNTFGGLGINGTGGVSWLQVWPFVFNGTTWDRVRGNTLGTFVQGPIADGSALTGFPVRIGGGDVITPAGAAVNIKTLAVNAFGGSVTASVGAAAADGLSNTLIQDRVIDNNGTVNVATNRNIPYVFNETTWDRLRGAAPGDNTSQIANTGVQRVIMALTNGAGFTRNWISLNQMGDAGGGDNVGSVGVGLFNGASWDRARTADSTTLFPATTVTSRNAIGAQLTEKSSRYGLFHNPAAGSQATISLAAEASVKHILDCVSFSAVSGGAVTAATGTINIRDGATGAGTVIWNWAVAFRTAAAAGEQLLEPHSICGLGLVGSTATAITAEFSAGVTNVIQSISMNGYNVN